MNTEDMYDALVRMPATDMEGPTYEILSFLCEDVARLSTMASIAVLQLNLKGIQRHREIVAYGKCGSFNAWVRERGEYDEWWGDYNA
ncbi:MAG: hypothetical protein AAFX78_19855 [Cyanobacteria bacterium J06638_20]